MSAHIELLHRMLAVPSESCAEGQLARLLVDWMRDLGFTAELDQAGNVVGELDRGPGPTVMLLGHLDTVAGAIPVRLDGNRLYGRGAVDAKGPLAAMVCAAASSIGFRGRLIVVGAVEEETVGSRGATEIGRRVPQPDALIVGEPSGADSVVVGYKGKLDLRYEVRCPAVHPASPAPKAVELAVGAWAELLAVLGPVSHASFGQPGATLVGLSGDAALASATFSVRTPIGFDAGNCVEELDKRLRTGSLEVLNAVAACRVPRTDPVVRALSAAIRDAGRGTRYKNKTATSDMNTMAEVWDCPMATYGPGDSRLDHGADEHIDVTEYLAGIEILRLALSTLATSLRAGTLAIAG